MKIIPKNEDDPKYMATQKEEDNPQNDDNPKWKTTSKRKTAPTRKRT